MLGEAAMGLSALNTAFNMAKGLKDMNDAVIRNGAVIELQENILAAQQAQAALVKRIGDLEKDVAGFEKWDAEKENYQLQQIGPDTFAYANKQNTQGTRPAHYICANCYENREKRILQRADSVHLFCPQCKTKFRFDSVQAADFARKLDYSPRGGGGPNSWMGT